MAEIWVASDFAGAQLGTKDNPFVAKTSAEFDDGMRAHAHVDQLAVHLLAGVFQTAGTKEWGDTNDVQANQGFRMGRNWTIDLAPGATLLWDYAASELTDVPLALLRSTEARFSGLALTPEECWAVQPRGQKVSGGTIDLQFSKAVDRWRAAGKTLRIGAVALAGHQAAIEGVHVTNYGAYKYEGFPLYIQGAYGQYDRNLIAQLDPATHIFDADLPDDQCSHITDCLADGYVELSDVGDQVTVRFVGGSVGERTPLEWIYHNRAFSYQTGNRTVASGSNAVQGHTVYQSLRALVEKNKTEGTQVGYYGDFYKTKGVEIRLNEFGTEAAPCYYGVQLLLSPVAAGMGNAADDFSHEDYVIGPNKIVSRSANVKLDTLGPSTATRYIRNISVDAALSLENNGATNVTRTGVVAKRGCNPLGWFR